MQIVSFTLSLLTRKFKPKIDNKELSICRRWLHSDVSRLYNHYCYYIIHILQSNLIIVYEMFVQLSLTPPNIRSTWTTFTASKLRKWKWTNLNSVPSCYVMLRRCIRYGVWHINSCTCTSTHEIKFGKLSDFETIVCTWFHIIWTLVTHFWL